MAKKSEFATNEEARLAKLNSEFSQLDRNGDGSISKDELIVFFQNRGCTDRQAINQIFASLDANKDGSISLEEYVRAYNQEFINLQNQFNQSKQNLEQYQRKIDDQERELQDIKRVEVLNPTTGIREGKSDDDSGKLKIHLIEARNLPAMDVSGTSDPYAILTIEPSDVVGKEPQMTSEVIWGNLNPRWDQHFVFCPILSKAGSVRIKVMDKDRLMKDDVIGEIVLPFSALLDQMEHDDWLELRGEEAKGQIHVKAQFIYSFQESCVQAIRILGQKINEETAKLEEYKHLLAEMEKPFSAVSQRRSIAVPANLDEGVKLLRESVVEFNERLESMPNEKRVTVLTYLWYLIHFLVFWFVFVSFMIGRDSLTRSATFGAVWTSFIMIFVGMFGSYIIKEQDEDREYWIGSLIGTTFMLSMVSFMQAVLFGGMITEYEGKAPASEKLICMLSVFCFLAYLVFTFLLYKFRKDAIEIKNKPDIYSAQANNYDMRPIHAEEKASFGHEASV